MPKKRALEPPEDREVASESITRREMIANSALGGVALAGLAAAGASLIPVTEIHAAQASTAVVRPVTALLPDLRRVLDALVDRIIPNDENGPGALDAGAADYIDRAL